MHIKRIIFVTFLLFICSSTILDKNSFASETGDPWSIRCSGSGDKKHCEMFQTLVMKDTKQRLSEFAIGYVDSAGNSKRKIRGVIILPLGVLVQNKVIALVDGKAIFSASPRYCLASGCYVFVNLSEKILDKFRKGNKVVFTVKAMNGNNVDISMSLKGFTKTLRELNSYK